MRSPAQPSQHGLAPWLLVPEPCHVLPGADPGENSLVLGAAAPFFPSHQARTGAGEAFSPGEMASCPLRFSSWKPNPQLRRPAPPWDGGGWRSGPLTIQTGLAAGGLAEAELAWLSVSGRRDKVPRKQQARACHYLCPGPNPVSLAAPGPRSKGLSRDTGPRAGRGQRRKGRGGASALETLFRALEPLPSDVQQMADGLPAPEAPSLFHWLGDGLWGHRPS